MGVQSIPLGIREQQQRRLFLIQTRIFTANCFGNCCCNNKAKPFLSKATIQQGIKHELKIKLLLNQ